MKASDLLEPGETALVISTYGEHFEVDAEGNGTTGHWVISPRRKIDRVIIYKRDGDRRRQEVYTGTPVGLHKSHREGRYVIALAEVRNLGPTTTPWHEFADLKKNAQNPIRYVTR